VSGLIKRIVASSSLGALIKKKSPPQ